MMISRPEMVTALQRGLRSALKDVSDSARSKLPARSGRLRRGLLYGVDKEPDKVQGRIGWPKGPFYARFVEYGRKASSKLIRPRRRKALRIGSSGVYPGLGPRVFISGAA